jgi:putative SOS response-associated peptidase YedK
MLLSVGPNELLKPIHDRKPVILRTANSDQWWMAICQLLI